MKKICLTSLPRYQRAFSGFCHPELHMNLETMYNSSSEETNMSLYNFIQYAAWVRHLLIWTAAPVYFVYFLTSIKFSWSWSGMKKIKTTGFVLLITLTTIFTAMSVDFETILHISDEFPLRARLAFLVLSITLIYVEMPHATFHALFLFAFWGLALVLDCSDFFYRVSVFNYKQLGAILISSFCVISTGTCLIFSCSPKFGREDSDSHPGELCSIPTSLLLSWITDIIYRGYKNGLHENDVPCLSKQDRCQIVCSSFERSCIKETNRILEARFKDSKTINTFEKQGNIPRTKMPKVSLFIVLLRHFGLEYLVYQIMKVLFELSQFLDPILLSYLLSFLQNRDNEPSYKGYAIVIVTFFFQLIRCVGHSRTCNSVDRLAKKIEISLKMALYKKALTARNEDKRNFSTAEIISLVCDHCEKFVNAINDVYLILATPVQICVALYMLQKQMGIGAFVGLVIMLALIPLNKWIGKKLRYFEKRKNEFREQRVKIINEILNGIKVLKLYAWENSFLKRVMDLRDEEIKLHKKMYLLNSCVDFMYDGMAEYTVRVGTFIIFIYFGGYLDPSTAFVTAALFSILNTPFSKMAFIIPEFVQASRAFSKVDSFFNMQDIPDDIVNQTAAMGPSVIIRDGIFTWNRSSTKNCLQNINVNISRGNLVAVVGSVGSGKSSILSAMLGEMEKVKGVVNISGSVAYVPQEAWILNTSLAYIRTQATIPGLNVVSRIRRIADTNVTSDARNVIRISNQDVNQCSAI